MWCTRRLVWSGRAAWTFVVFRTGAIEGAHSEATPDVLLGTNGGVGVQSSTDDCVRLRVIEASACTAYRVVIGSYRLAVIHTDGFRSPTGG